MFAQAYLAQIQTIANLRPRTSVNSANEVDHAINLTIFSI